MAGPCARRVPSWEACAWERAPAHGDCVATSLIEWALGAIDRPVVGEALAVGAELIPGS